ncbi:MAG: hypothetical protein ACI8PD_002111 [Nitrospinales bacterium]|jgi:hypothetical protein
MVLDIYFNCKQNLRKTYTKSYNPWRASSDEWEGGKMKDIKPIKNNDFHAELLKSSSLSSDEHLA